MKNNKLIGNIGESKVIAKFCEFGIPIFIPFGDNERIDLIAQFFGKLNRIQIKTSSVDNGEYVIFPTSSSYNHTTNKHRQFYDKSMIDYFALYNIKRDQIYIIPVDFNSEITHKN